jgi:hypothetical protein
MPPNVWLANHRQFVALLEFRGKITAEKRLKKTAQVNPKVN